MTYHADPGGVFETDTHRRVLGHLPLPGDDPISLYDDEGTARQQRRDSLYHRLGADDHTSVETVDELGDVLADLEAAGYAVQSKGGWKMSKAGFDALTGPNAGEEA